MKKYLIPEITVETVFAEDIMTASVGTGYGMSRTWSGLFEEEINEAHIEDLASIR